MLLRSLDDVVVIHQFPTRGWLWKAHKKADGRTFVPSTQGRAFLFAADVQPVRQRNVALIIVAPDVCQQAPALPHHLE
jgi:hypothetical protein